MSVATKMTAIADKIRNLLGISGAMGLDAMATNLSEVESEVGNQADLISQIASALEGKAGGGNSGDVQTCTVTLVNNISFTNSLSTFKFGHISCTDGICSYTELTTGIGSMTIENVVCGSYFYLYQDGISLSVNSEDGTSYQAWGNVFIGTSNTTITISV